MRKRYSTEFICLCTECEAITTGIAVEISAQTRYALLSGRTGVSVGQKSFTILSMSLITNLLQFWKDDRQVFDIHIVKRYEDNLGSRWEVEIESV